MKKDTLYINTTAIISYFFLRTAHYEDIKRVYGSRYKPKKDIWVFPAMPPFYSWVLEDIESALEDRITFDHSVVQYRSRMDSEESKALSGDTKGFSSAFPPYDHQKEGLAKILHYPRCGIFWDPGMGKTKLICDRILWERQRNPQAKTLILGLKVNLSTWVNEMAIHSEGREEIVALSPPSKKESLLKGAIESNSAGIVCTYETARSATELIRQYDYTIIVADECHKMQSYRSKNTLAALKLSTKARYRYILSGTPTKGRPTDIWASLRFLGTFIVPRYSDFDKKYVARSHYNRNIIIGYKNLDILNDTISEVSDIKKSEDCLDLPQRTFQVVHCKATPTQKRIYNKIVKTEEGSISVKGEDVPIPNLITKISKASQVCSGYLYKSLKDPEICDRCPHLKSCIKEEIEPYTSRCHVVTKSPGNKVISVGKDASSVINNCVELCSSHVQNNKKVIVWAKHKETLRVLYERISKLLGESQVLRYDSSMDDPGKVEKEFNTNPEKKVIIAQITMGIGVTFKAPIMIYTELSFNLADWLQSLDRNWGIRAKGLGPILVQILLIKGSIYEQTYGLLKHKIDVASIIKDRPDCTTCPEIFNCLKNKIEPYDPLCILDKSVQSYTLKLKEIK